MPFHKRSHVSHLTCFFSTVLLCLTLTGQGLVAQESSQGLTPIERKQLEEALNKPPMYDTLTWRAGPVVSGMFSSNQPNPFLYIALGARRKTSTFYLDLHLPVLMGGADGMLYLFQNNVLDQDDPFSILRALNGYPQFLAVELAHLRLGKTMEVFAGRDEETGTGGFPLRLSAGFVGMADFIVVEASRAELFVDEELENDRDAFEDLISLDPLMAGLGGFVALGGYNERLSFDIALEVSRDLLNPTGYAESDGWVFAIDGESQVEIIDNLGMYIRAKWSLLTHLSDPYVYVMTVGSGVVFRL